MASPVRPSAIQVHAPGDAAAPREPSLALPGTVARGIAYAHDWSYGGLRGYGTASDRAQLERLRALGADWVCVMPFGYLSGLRATEVQASYNRPGSETDRALALTIREAHARGFRVLLKPHLWIHGSWPGALTPASPEATRALLGSWGALTLHYADLAARERVEALTVGVELDPLARADPAGWRALVRDVRARYRGLVTYSCNWSEVETIPFWDALDVVSVNHYAPLADAPGPADPDALEARARASIARYASVGRAVGRPVWLTELGYRRDARALVEPWAWVEQVPDAGAMDLQSLGLRATLRAVAREPLVTGVFVWKWFTSGGTEEEGDRGFVFAGRPGEAVVREAFRAP